MLLKKGAEINAVLVELLANPVLELPLIYRGKPGEKPAERLRRFLDLIDGRLQAIRAGRYGRCERCGDGLPYEHLEQVPWIDTCQACAAKLAEEEEP
jgi:RNA polymerase-binding transcription factor DksA